MKAAVRLVILILCMCWTAHAGTSVDDARAVLSALQPQLSHFVALSPEELDGKTPDFRGYYLSDVAPRLNNIAARIKPSAMHWIDVDWDGQPELICWTEGLAPTGWGAKEYILIIKVPDPKTPTIVRSRQLYPEPSRGAGKYKYVRFTPHPNKGRGANEHLAAVFSYADYGGSGTTYYNFEIGWNRYEETVYVDRFLSAFPVAVQSVRQEEM